MRVSNGDTVLMRDGRTVYVTDAADPGDPEGVYQWIGRNEERTALIVKDEMPAETIFVGECNGRTVVSDMSEVVSILT